MKKKPPSELRMDLVSEDWVIVAASRAKKPTDFKKGNRNSFQGTSSKNCPFCDLKEQKPAVYTYPKGKNWRVAVVPNKYPALSPDLKLDERTEGGFYKKMNAVGFHEVVVTKSHYKQIGDMKEEEVKEVIDAWQSRYLAVKGEKFVNHVSIYQNHGYEAGATMAHPHSQIMTTFLLDVDLKNALSRAKSYYDKNKKCLYCDMTKYELKVRKRIVFENKNFVAVCPFASKSSFQTIITPKKHLPYFEKIEEEEKNDLAQILKIVLYKMKKGLKNPSYNFYIHTAPADGKEHEYYHWHLTILPKTQDWAGFEIGTRLEIIAISPEDAAKYLRKI